MEKERRLHGRLGFPLYDVRQLILHQNKENANTPHSPEGTNLLFAEGIKKEFSLYDVFSIDVGEAHTAGDLHIHGLGYIDRPYSCCQSLEYLKLFGLKLPHAINSAKHAKHAEVLRAHMVRFSAILQGHFTGTISWDALNISFAPYLCGKGDKEIRQFALVRFLRNIFDQSVDRQIDFTPEFTSCLSCGKTAPGLTERCEYWGSADVEGIARLTKYYSKISGWNKGKIAELRSRKISGDF